MLLKERSSSVSVLLRLRKTPGFIQSIPRFLSTNVGAVNPEKSLSVVEWKHWKLWMVVFPRNVYSVIFLRLLAVKISLSGALAIVGCHLRGVKSCGVGATTLWFCFNIGSTGYIWIQEVVAKLLKWAFMRFWGSSIGGKNKKFALK